MSFGLVITPVIAEAATTFEFDKYTEDLSDFVEFVKDETLALEFVKTTGLNDIYDINDYKVSFKVEKI